MKNRIINSIIILLGTGNIMYARWDEASNNIAVAIVLLIELAISMFVAIKIEKFREGKKFSLKYEIGVALLIVMEILILAGILSYGWPAAIDGCFRCLLIVIPVVLFYYAICAAFRKKRD